MRRTNHNTALVTLVLPIVASSVQVIASCDKRVRGHPYLSAAQAEAAKAVQMAERCKYHLRRRFHLQECKYRRSQGAHTPWFTCSLRTTAYEYCDCRDLPAVVPAAAQTVHHLYYITS